MLYCNMQISVYFYTSFILKRNIATFDVLQKEHEIVFIAFWQTFLKLPSNTFRIGFQFVKFPWEKYHMLRTHEDGRMFSLPNKFLLYIFKRKWNREIGQLLTKTSKFVQFNNKKHLLQCRVRYSDVTIKI